MPGKPGCGPGWHDTQFAPYPRVVTCCRQRPRRLPLHLPSLLRGCEAGGSGTPSGQGNICPCHAWCRKLVHYCSALLASAEQAEELPLGSEVRAHYTAHPDCLPTHQPSQRRMQPSTFRKFLERHFNSREAVQSAMRRVEEELVAHGEALPVRAAQQAGAEAPATGGEA